MANNNPPIHDPERMVTQRATQRAQRKRSYAGKTPEEILREAPDRVIASYAHRGAELAILERERRLDEAMELAPTSFASQIPPDPDLDIGV